ncbi:MAG: Acryloyl-CoA reductase (NADH) [Alphaproteobacteria bacterium MarineAlpha4_Bin2]|nr:MAG: Acryloyl-CoA reductase (NADH) [Alphaproteobacteria bacterium MarineAlpha4_Bin2]
MDFSLTEEQQLLKDSVDRFVRENYEFEDRRKLAGSGDGYSVDNWKQMAELGWLAVALPEEFGGIGGGATETMVIMEGFGRGLVLEPFFATVVLGANLILQAGSAAQKENLLPRLAEGNLKLCFAYAERQARFDLNDVETKAEHLGGGYTINGAKGVVFGAATADKIVVAARTSGNTRDTNGITLFLVDANAAGVTRRDYVTNDALRASEIAFENVSVGKDAILGKADCGYPVVERVAEFAIAALCAEAVGCMDVLKEETNEYIKTREQFGQPIGKFQVLQHRMVDILINCEEARSMAYVATAMMDSDDADERARSVAAAKAQIGKSARFVGQNSIQMHGGMGMTDELKVGHYFKRLTMIDLTFGDRDHHTKRFATMT